MKRTSLNIEPQLFAEIAEESHARGVTQTQLIKLMLVNGLKELRENRQKPRKFSIPAYGTGGTVAGVDLSDRRALFDLLDNENKDR